MGNINKSKIYTKVIRGGKLKPYQGVSKKGGGLSLKGITEKDKKDLANACLLYTSPSPRDRTRSRMPSSA